jgi:hypothetical protein
MGKPGCSTPGFSFDQPFAVELLARETTRARFLRNAGLDPKSSEVSVRSEEQVPATTVIELF